jgi:hypothetical protein
MNPHVRTRRELAARRELVDPHAHVRSLPPEGELASLEAALREAP